MYCSACGGEVAAGVQFCPKCGQAMAFAAPAAYAAQPGLGTAHAVAGRRYAGFWLRVVAHVIDSAILIIPCWLIFVVVMVAAGGTGVLLNLRDRGTGDPAAVAAALAPMIGIIFLAVAFLIVGVWLYYAYFESSPQQATIGKKVMSLRVTDRDGNRLSFGHASGRYFSKIITGLVPLGIGWILAGVTERKQALHDFIAGTLVWRDN